MQGHSQLAGTEVGPEVASDLADRVDYQLAHLLRDLLQLRPREPVKVLRAVDVVEEAHVCLVSM